MTDSSTIQTNEQAARTLEALATIFEAGATPVGEIERRLLAQLSEQLNAVILTLGALGVPDTVVDALAEPLCEHQTPAAGAALVRVGAALLREKDPDQIALRFGWEWSDYDAPRITRPGVLGSEASHVSRGRDSFGQRRVQFTGPKPHQSVRDAFAARCQQLDAEREALDG